MLRVDPESYSSDCKTHDTLGSFDTYKSTQNQIVYKCVYKLLISPSALHPKYAVKPRTGTYVDSYKERRVFLRVQEATRVLFVPAISLTYNFTSKVSLHCRLRHDGSF